jgi:hypothetical protein
MPPWHHSRMDPEKRISLRLPADLHERLVDRARTDRRSLNSEIIHLLEVAIGPAAKTPDRLDGVPAPHPAPQERTSSPAERRGVHGGNR